MILTTHKDSPELLELELAAVNAFMFQHERFRGLRTQNVSEGAEQDALEFGLGNLPAEQKSRILDAAKWSGIVAVAGVIGNKTDSAVDQLAAVAQEASVRAFQVMESQPRRSGDPGDAIERLLGVRLRATMITMQDSSSSQSSVPGFEIDFVQYPPPLNWHRQYQLSPAHLARIEKGDALAWSEVLWNRGSSDETSALSQLRNFLLTLPPGGSTTAMVLYEGGFQNEVTIELKQGYSNSWEPGVFKVIEMINLNPKDYLA